MSFTDRDYNQSEGGGKVRHVFGRIFGDSENPLGWSLPLGSAFGIRVKLHLLFVILIPSFILWSITKDGWGAMYTTLIMGTLFAVVLVHEFGHCFACRWAGGDADEIILWPLGGLAMCAPPHTWRANLITTAGGPLVNVVLFPITSAALAVMGYPESILFNPFNWVPALTASGSWVYLVVWVLHAVNLMILAFNVLLPMYPMDGARLVQALLWRKQGYRKATEITTIAGVVAAGVVGIFAILTNQMMLLAIAFFGGLVSWQTRQQVRMEEYSAVGGGYSVPEWTAEAEDPGKERQRRAEEKQHEREEKERAEVDRILAKIAEKGMGSLSVREKRALHSATKKRQGG